MTSLLLIWQLDNALLSIQDRSWDDTLVPPCCDGSRCLQDDGFLKDSSADVCNGGAQMRWLSRETRVAIMVVCCHRIEG